jgi:hypothetical protein
MDSKNVCRIVAVLGLTALIALAAGFGGQVAHAQGGNPHIVNPRTGDPAVGGEADLWVYPIGDPAQDKPNVQWAVDRVAVGGTVLLKAHDIDGNPRSFDFGTEVVVGSFNVEISHSCTVEGEILKETHQEPEDPLYGQPIMTTIENGAAVFAVWGAWDSYANRVDVRIRNLISRDAAIHVIGTFDFADVEIENVQIVDLAASPDYGARIALFAHSHGKYTVKNSMVRMKPAPFDVPLEAGIAYKGLNLAPFMIGAELEFVGNDVATQHGAGILVEDNALADEPKDITISRNKVAGPVGISATRLHGVCILDKNTINATIVGIALDTVAKSTIRHNSIDTASGSAAGLQLHDVANSKVRQNRVAGDAAFGLLIEGSSYGNKLVLGEGDMSALRVAEAHVHLAAETHDNRLALNDDDLVIVDLGTNNRIGDDEDR